jgi:ComEC/Rec2-related protein
MEERHLTSISPVVAFAVCYASGILLAAGLRPAPVYFPVFLLFILTACCLTQRRPKGFLCCAAGCAVLLGMYAVSVRTMPSRDIVAVWRGSCELRGVVVTDEDTSENFSLKVQEFCQEGRCRRAGGRVRVRVKQALRPHVSGAQERGPFLFYGDRVACRGRLAPMTSLGRIFRAKGDDAVLWLQAPVARLGWSRAAAYARGVFLARRYFSRRIRLFHSGEAARILEGVLLGKRTEFPEALREDAVRAGTWHIFVVSGSHVGIIAFGIMVLLKILRLRGKARAVATVLLLCAYCLLTGASAPVVRATVMSCAFIFCLIVERNPLFLNALCLAGLAILFFDPLQLFSRAFQLSFLSVFFIFWMYPLVDPAAAFERYLPRASFLGRWGRWLATGGAVSFCAWLGTAPLIAYAFGNLSLIGLIANVVIVPLAGLVMAAGFSFLCFSWLVPLARYLAAADDFLVSVFLRTNRFFAGIHGVSFRGFRLSFMALMGIYLFIFLIVVILKRRKQIPS